MNQEDNCLNIFIIKKRDEIGFTQKELAEKINTTESNMNSIETGKTKQPRLETLEKLSIALSVPFVKLVELANYSHPERTMNKYLEKKAIYNQAAIQTEQKLKSIKVKEYSTSYSKKCPLLFGNASCGQPFTITDNCIEDYIPYPDNIETPDFAIEAKGVSMLEKGIAPGTICFIKKCQPSSGDVAVICIYNGEEVFPVLKEIRFKNGYPEFYDGKSEKVFFGKDINFEIVGKVVYVSKVF